MSAPAPPPPPGTGSARLVPTVRPGRGGLGRCRALAGRAIELPRGGRGWDPGELQGVPCAPPPPNSLASIHPRPFPSHPGAASSSRAGESAPLNFAARLGLRGLGMEAAGARRRLAGAHRAPLPRCTPAPLERDRDSCQRLQDP
ncbi:unnamed protein product [Caretta caretta]